MSARVTCLVSVFRVVPQNPDCALKARARRCALAVGHPLESNTDSRTGSPSIHDDALQQAKTRCIRPALDERRKGAVTRRDSIDWPELSNAAVGTCFSIKHLSCKSARGITPRKACKENDVLTGIAVRERCNRRRCHPGPPLREGDFEVLVVLDSPCGPAARTGEIWSVNRITLNKDAKRVAIRVVFIRFLGSWSLRAVDAGLCPGESECVCCPR